ncbi:MAG: PEP-CTERM sorting domain-containing protein [Bryobacteraceae bacterium]
MKTLIALIVGTGCLSASTIYLTPTGASDGDGPLSAQVAFSLSHCVMSPAACTLDIAITNNQASPNAAGQLISDLTFALANGTTELNSPGTLQTTFNSSVGTVTLAGSTHNLTATTGSTTSVGNWQFSFENNASGFLLNDLTGGQPKDMIIGPGPYTNGNASLTNFNPSYTGTVDFTINNFAGLSSSTTLSNVVASFGTGPDGFSTLACSTGCSGTIQGGQVPEPFSLLLVSGGLLGIGLLRRRFSV